ncbi:Ger(x)C family spore germination protein [Alkaliphilus peptidifermentans]|uniref:Spore germination protein KC n=1 Tax=Alkaliphilus peptidifermentans DSM 18978 TaxID=1120976 RepID=A0A1G5ILM6_9FIRM|nr:Ger(x)C family spore germination protein [Alkaliphilus peptidifermentans]SCY76923.1 spore germination protein KC [Alkaliphilus peptidifermentans DSM 18978]
MKKIFIVIIIICIILSIGCWDKKELDERAYVMGIGIDLGTENQLKLSTQVVHQNQKAPQEETDTNGLHMDFVLTQECNTLFEASKKFMNFSNRKLFYGHNEVVVFGEEFAKSGIVSSLNWFERQAELRPHTIFLVAKGEAKKILECQSLFEQHSARAMKEAVRSDEITNVVEVTLHSFLGEYASRGSAVMPKIEIATIEGKKTFRIGEFGVFKKDKLVGWLDEKASSGYLLIVNRKNPRVIIVPVPNSKDGKASIELANNNAKIIADYKENSPTITVEIMIDGNLKEQTAPVSIGTPEKLQELNMNFKKAIEEEVETAIGAAQQYKTDVFGFGEALHRKDYTKWNEIKEDWDEIFSNMEVNISVKTEIKHLGMVVTPITPK